MEHYLILTQQRNSTRNKYKDVVGDIYHFPVNKKKNYLNQFANLPAKFIYYEPTSNGGKGEFFGCGEILESPLRDVNNEGYYFAKIKNYFPFTNPVHRKNKKGVIEEQNNPHYNAQNAVRKTTKELYIEICAAGGVGTVARANNKNKIKGVAPFNAKLFLTKTWGFNPEEYPFVGFSSKAGQNKYLKEASRDDWVVIVGTREEPTPPEQQGKILGICKLGKEKIDPVTVLNEIGTTIKPHEYKKNGEYRWLWALPMLKAKKLDPPVDCNSVIGSYLPGQHWATYAQDVEAKLGVSAVKDLLSLNYKDCEVHDITSLNQANVFSDTLNLERNYGRTGPPPSSKRSGSERELGKGYTYALKLIGRDFDAFKIGMTHDVEVRLKTLNSEIRPVVTGCSWEPFLIQSFLTEQMANNFEQIILNHFVDYKFYGEREIIKVSPKELLSIWGKLFAQKKWL